MNKVTTELITVESSMIKTAWYQATCETLVLDFTNGSSYRYKDVPRYVYEGLRSSDSKGKFINKNIITKFEFTKW